MTDITTRASAYCLLNIKKYEDKRKREKQQLALKQYDEHGQIIQVLMHVFSANQ